MNRTDLYVMMRMALKTLKRITAAKPNSVLHATEKSDGRPSGFVIGSAAKSRCYQASRS